jgi:hypothetical protein
MLANPDIALTASINRWIVSILMFQFELVHVPGASHSPDGLSRRRPQPGGQDEPEDDFDDWIDQVHGFPHMVLSPSAHATHQPPSTIYIFASSIGDPGENIEDPDDIFDRTHVYPTKSDPYSMIASDSS